jgi:hypothetical protein
VHLQKVNQNLFRRCKECLRVEGQHFLHLLWSVNKGKNFPSFQMLSARWVIGSIRMRSAARSAPVPVKRSAVNASSWLKTTLYNETSTLVLTIGCMNIQWSLLYISSK